MKFIIKPFSEIIIKSKPVRKRYLNFLQTNCNLSFKQVDENIKARLHWDKWEVNVYTNLSDLQKQELITKLSRMPWIESFLEVIEFDLWDFDDIFEKAKSFFLDKIENKTFVVRVKRTWNHDFRSIDLEKYLWWKFLEFSSSSKVKLKSPDITINIEINENKLFLVKKKHIWIWGYPVWTQDKVISLVSGWFDSWVATFSMMKRGCKVDFLFFNLWWKAHEVWVKEVSNYIWKNFSSGYRSRFITINFEEIVWSLLKNINHKYRWIILKRLFLKCADFLAKENEYYAIIKWDSLGQVSSQTLKNMFAIDKASETLVLRPLISFNKQEIVDISLKIGTYEYACNMPEYCWVISDRPATAAKLEKVLDEEKNFDFSLLEKALEERKIEKIDEVLDFVDEERKIEVSSLPRENEIILDIREEQKQESNPLIFEWVEIMKIPFFDINYEFENLDQTKVYLFYCDKWILSENHAISLSDKWFKNIKIFRPILDDKWCRIKTWK